MLKLSRLGQKVGQLLAVLRDDGWLAYTRTLPPATAGLNGEDIEEVA